MSTGPRVCFNPIYEKEEILNYYKNLPFAILLFAIESPTLYLPPLGASLQLLYQEEAAFEKNGMKETTLN
jgi:hypothetical protein